MRTVLATAACVLAACAVGCHAANRKSHNSPHHGCDPAYRLASQEPIVADAPLELRVTASWVLVGCRANLDGMTDRDMLSAAATLRTIAAEQGHGLRRVHRDLSLRKSFAERINDSLGRQVVTDLYLAGVNLGHVE